LKEYSFGIIPFFRNKKGIQFLLVQHRAGHWGFPKGRAEPGETPIQAAHREFVEETGIEDYSVIDGIEFEEHYVKVRDNKERPKTVHYFLAEAKSRDVSIPEHELKAYRWEDFEAAHDLVTHDGAKRVLKEANEFLSIGKKQYGL